MDRGSDAPRLRLAAAVTVLGLLPALSPLAGGLRAATPSVTVSAEADAFVAKAEPARNFGKTTSLQADEDPEKRAYLRFNVTGLQAAVQRATLRLMVSDKSKNGPALYGTGTSWSESGLSWDNKPSLSGDAAADTGAVTAGSWATYDVTSLVKGNGLVAFALVSDSSDGTDFNSREAAGDRPQLVVETATTTSSPSSSTSSSTSTTARPTTTTTRPATTTTTTRPSRECDDGWGDGELVGKLPSGRGEMSGLSASRNHEGWAWGIRDSGNPASLYSFRLHDDGDIDTDEFPVDGGARNSDWEDVTWLPGTNGQGELWVMDNVGNSHTGNRRFYRVLEPDPEGNLLTDLFDDAVPLSARQLARYDWAYPDQQHNTEAVFAFDGDLVVISKTSPSRVYRFTEPFSTSRVNVPEYVGTLPAGNNLSVAGATTGRRYLAVASHNSAYIYENTGDRDNLADLFADAPIWRETLPTDNREGGGFFPHGSCDLILVAESKNVWRVAGK